MPARRSRRPRLSRTLSAALLAGACASAAATDRYTIDPEHTYPSFEADHMGISTWRGKFNRTTGSVTLDRAAGTGTVEVAIDPASIDFGHDVLNRHALGPDLLDTARYPRASYRGTLRDFRDGAPTRLVGQLTLHGVTRPVELQVADFECVPHPIHKRQQCGADASGSFQRDDFGMDAGKDYGFDMTVDLRIQVEALHDE